MENTIKFEGNEKKWNYTICPCLECPIYPHIKEWENDPDIRNNKCWSSRCTYDKMKAKEMSDWIYFIKNYYYCENCDKSFSKNEIDEDFCPDCGNYF